MSYLKLFIMLALTVFFSACSQETKTETQEEKKETSKASTNPVNTYLDSRVNAIGSAKASVIQSNKKTEEQNKAMDDLLGR
ncbi:MAG: hypothetical protein GQ531_02830 [Sulfurovum sp.]|nr:hypothetical protein [Sulfurovum sp.]